MNTKYGCVHFKTLKFEPGSFVARNRCKSKILSINKVITNPVPGSEGTILFRNTRFNILCCIYKRISKFFNYGYIVSAVTRWRVVGLFPANIIIFVYQDLQTKYYSGSLTECDVCMKLCILKQFKNVIYSNKIYCSSSKYNRTDITPSNKNNTYVRDLKW